jgi:hypothetical protein
LVIRPHDKDYYFNQQIPRPGILLGFSPLPPEGQGILLPYGHNARGKF